MDQALMGEEKTGAVPCPCLSTQAGRTSPLVYTLQTGEKRHRRAWSDSLWEVVGEAAQHLFHELPVSKL